ncbi:MAPK protein hog1 [Puccinia graminis f. sp. tritici]|uniref:MAPK protein hog1 n=1 Tax=Puccinia graminis f. sp. tritici TaxID=56615 RepID=A0A5B0S965_PUCGR|nr:MAPK protein hog1 [Puccinia graminis f. sp. tritici]
MKRDQFWEPAAKHFNQNSPGGHQEGKDLSTSGTVFEVTTRYTDLQPVGMGAFGLVCLANDQLTATNVAIKKIMKPFST